MNDPAETDAANRSRCSLDPQSISMKRLGPAHRHNRRNTDAWAGAPGSHARVNSTA